MNVLRYLERRPRKIRKLHAAVLASSVTGYLGGNLVKAISESERTQCLWFWDVWDEFAGFLILMTTFAIFGVLLYFISKYARHEKEEEDYLISYVGGITASLLIAFIYWCNLSMVQSLFPALLSYGVALLLYFPLDRLGRYLRKTRS